MTLILIAGLDSTPSAVTVIETGSDWVYLSWDDSIWCQDAIVGYSISLYKSPNLISSDQQTQSVPLECVNRTVASTFFDTRECPDLFKLQPCGRYYVSIQAQSLDNELSDASSRKEFTTLPRKYCDFFPMGCMDKNAFLKILFCFIANDLESNVDSFESGSNWISFKWNLSSSQCQASLTGYQVLCINA